MDTYRAALGARGATRRERDIDALKNSILTMAKDNPAYKQITINGVDKNVVIHEKDTVNTLEIASMPGDTIPLGAYVTYRSMKWLTVSARIDDEVYGKCTIKLCNAMLKWVDKNGETHIYHGIAEDATKYSEGIVTGARVRTGEFQLKITVALNAQTAQICRDMRFLIDAEHYISGMQTVGVRPSAYRVSRRNVVTGTYNSEGCAEITLVEDQFIEGADDAVNMIAAQPWTMCGQEIHNAVSVPDGDRGWL